ATTVAHVSASTPDGTLTNTATAASTTTDPNPANNVATATTTVQAQADVGVAKTGPATAIAGTDLTYTITVTNSGPSDAQNVVLSDILPSGTTFVSASSGTGSGTSYSATLGTLAAGATTIITLI